MNDKSYKAFIPFCSRSRQSVVFWQYIIHYASDLGLKNTVWDGTIQYVGIIGGASYSFCCPFQGGLKKISYEEFADNVDYAALGLFVSMDHAIDGSFHDANESAFAQSVKSQCQVKHAHVEPEYDYLEDCSDPPEPYDFAFVDVIPFSPVSRFEKSWIQSSMTKIPCHRGIPIDHNQKQFILASDAKISEFYEHYSELARTALSIPPLDFENYPASFELDDSPFNRLRSQFVITCKWCCQEWDTKYDCIPIHKSDYKGCCKKFRPDNPTKNKGCCFGPPLTEAETYQPEFCTVGPNCCRNCGNEDSRSLSGIILKSKSSKGEISYTIGTEINSPLIELEGWHSSSKIRTNQRTTD